MPNIPRRKIVEKTYELEDYIVELEGVCRNYGEFLGCSDKLDEKIFEIVGEINSLVVVFFQQEVFKSDEEYKNLMTSLNTHSKILKNEIGKCKAFPKVFLELSEEVLQFKSESLPKTLAQKKLFLKAVKNYNSFISKLLEINKSK